MKNRVISIISWVIVLWTAKIFLSSLPYKFSAHPDTQHIFGTIGAWMQDVLGDSVGSWFINYGAYAVGSTELIASIILLSPVIFWGLKKSNMQINLPERRVMHGIGGLISAGIMSGAVFFHLFTPLGVEVLHEGKSDHGSLFFAALSILVLGSVMFVLNIVLWNTSKKTY